MKYKQSLEDLQYEILTDLAPTVNIPYSELKQIIFKSIDLFLIKLDNYIENTDHKRTLRIVNRDHKKIIDAIVIKNGKSKIIMKDDIKDINIRKVEFWFSKND